MNPASVKEIKSALEYLDKKELLTACLRLAKFKKENKELLTYIVFEASDEAGYIENVKASLADLFADVNCSNLYFAKKTLRKIVRTANRYIRYSDDAATEPEILIYTAQKMLALGLNFKKSTALENIYLSLIKRIQKSIFVLHDDLQYDFNKKLEYL